MKLSRCSIAVASIALVASFGCTLPALEGGDGKPAPIHLTLAGAERLNPDEAGQSLPTSVRVYQLASRSKLEYVELTELLRDPKAILGDGLLATEELILEPGETIDRVIARAEDARVLLVVMLARLPAGESWREVIDLGDPRSTNRIKLTLEEYRIGRR